VGVAARLIGINREICKPLLAFTNVVSTKALNIFVLLKVGKLFRRHATENLVWVGLCWEIVGKTLPWDGHILAGNNVARLINKVVFL